MILDKGSPNAITESSMEAISPIKLNLIHLSQNPEPASTKTVATRMYSRERTPVTRNEDFFMVRQTSGSASDFRTNNLDRLYNTYRPSDELNQDHLKINSQSYDDNRFLLYSSDNNSLCIYHQRVRGLQGKTINK
jgi:hypothetical protein